MSAPLYNIGPDAIADPGTPGGPGLTLARPEWIAIQARCTDVLALPTTADAFRKSLGAGAPEDLSDFDRLIEAYEALQAHVTTWTTTTFPAAVALAGDVHQYGTVQAPVYYPRILEEAEILERDPHDEQAKAALKAMLDHLRAGRGREVRQGRAGVRRDRPVRRRLRAGRGDPRRRRRHGRSGQVLRHGVRLHQRGGRAADHGDRRTEGDPDVGRRRVRPRRRHRGHHADLRLVLAGRHDRGRGGGRQSTASGRPTPWTGREPLRARSTASPTSRPPTPTCSSPSHHAAVGAGTIVRGLTETLPVIQKIQGVWGGIAADLGALSALVDDDIAPCRRSSRASGSTRRSRPGTRSPGGRTRTGSTPTSWSSRVGTRWRPGRWPTRSPPPAPSRPT